MTTKAFSTFLLSEFPALHGGEQTMNEISCRVVIGVVEMAEARGIGQTRLLEGFRHPPEHIINPRNRTDWEILLGVLGRLRQITGSREAFVNIAELYGQTPAYGYFHQLAAAVFDPMQFYMYPNVVWLRMNFGPSLRYQWRKLGPRQVEFIYQTGSGYRCSDELWHFFVKTHAKLPRLIGLSDSQVELLSCDESTATYRTTVPSSGTLWARSWRFLRLARPAPAKPASPAKPPGPASGPKTAPVEPGPEASPPANEVSCRVILGFAEQADAYGIPRSKVLTGFRHAPEHLTNPRCRTDWEICLGVLAKLRTETGSREAFCEMARQYGQTPSYAFMKMFISGVFSPIHFYTYPQHIFLQHVLGKFITWHWTRRGGKIVEGVLSTDGAHPATLEFWDMCGVGMSKLPSFINLPDAVVRILSHDAHHAVYHIVIPPSGTLWARLGRFLRMHGTSPDPAFELFASEHEDLRRSYEVLNEIERERAELARELLRVADDERERFAREIHDGLGQELFALKLQAELIAGQASPELGGQAARLADLAGKAQAMARSLARSYDPIVGAAGNFADAVRMLAARYGGKFTFDLEGLRDLPVGGPQAGHLYRIVQEAVTNAMRHGQATEIRIALDFQGKSWELQIEDNGRGCEVKPDGQGMGLRTMTYRAAQLGGNLHMGPRPGGGTRVLCRFPSNGRAVLSP